MNIPKKFVSQLTDSQITVLENLMEMATSGRVRMRAHCILLSSKRISIDGIAFIYNIDRDSVSLLIDKWEEREVAGLYDKARPGAPPKLTESEIGIVKELIKEYPDSPKTILGKLYEQIGKSVSMQTLRRIVKKADMRWKRVRKSLKNKRDEEKFEKAEHEIEELKKKHLSGKTDLFYFDESGFSLNPSVPYAYQPIGETTEITSLSSKYRLNVLGFYSTDNRFESFCFECNIDSATVVRCFDEFAETIIRKTVVITDNSSIHHSDEFEENILKWKKKKLFIKYLPPYSPELNLIEILWRFIKHHWLSFSAYLSFENLVNSVENILRNIGSEYRIIFT